MGIVFPGPGDDNTKANNVTGTDEGDTIHGGAANDTLSGLGGDDLITGNFQDDQVFGGDGDDEISGGEDGNDRVDGGDGNDFIFESNLEDTLTGGAGDDIIVVRGTSRASGGAGNDTLQLGASGNINLGLGIRQGALTGGVGTDTLVIGGTVSFTCISFHAVGLGFERIEANNGVTGDNLANELNFSGLTLVGTEGLFVQGLGDNDEITGLDDAFHGDVLVGNSGNDTLNGGGGDDELFGDAGDDELEGGAGDDRIVGADPSAIVDSDVLSGGNDNDTITVRANAIAIGGNHDDTLKLSNYTVRNLGSDIDVSIDGDNPQAPDPDQGKNDLLVIGANVVFATLSFDFEFANFERLQADAAIFGNGSANELNFLGAVAGSSPIEFFGAAGDDEITGTVTDDRIHGQADDDILKGDEGDDQLFGEEHHDSLVGGLDFDTLDGGVGNDTLIGGDGTDELIDTDGVTASGGAGADKVTLNQARVFPGAVQGGTGVDTLISRDAVFSRLEGRAQGFEKAAGNFHGTDLTNLFDLSGLSNVPAEKIFIFAAGGDDIGRISAAQGRIDGQGGRDQLFATGLNSLLNGGDSDDRLSASGAGSTARGDDGNDIMNGGRGAYSIDGGNGIDTLVWHWLDAPLRAPELLAARGVTVDLSRSTGQNTGPGFYTITRIENSDGSKFDDRLIGESGANLLCGFEGDDALEGGAGDDTMQGGIGIDTASFSRAGAGVVVSLSIAGAQNTGQGLDTLIATENLEGSKFADKLTGNTLANVLLGGAGNDSLAGGAGPDTAIGGAGRDSFGGGAGADEMHFERIVDSRPGLAFRDAFSDFATSSDKLVFSAIDAMASVDGNQDFAFIGQGAFTGEGQIRAVKSGLNTIIEVNTVGAGGAEMQVFLANVDPAALGPGNFGI